MIKKRFTTEQIIGKLREAEVLQSKGESMESISTLILYPTHPISTIQQNFFMGAL